MKIFKIIVTVLCLFSTSFTKDIDTISAEGHGITLEKAEQDALCKAVESAVGIYLESSTIVKNNVLIEDRILSYSHAFVKEYSILSKTFTNLWSVKIKALVLTKEMKKTFSENNIETINSTPLFGESFTKIERQKDEILLCEKLISEYSSKAYSVNFNPPQIIGTDPYQGMSKLEITYKIYFSKDWIQSLKELLDLIKISTENSTLYTIIDGYSRGSRPSYLYDCVGGMGPSALAGDLVGNFILFTLPSTLGRIPGGYENKRNIESFKIEETTFSLLKKYFESYLYFRLHFMSKEGDTLHILRVPSPRDFIMNRAVRISSYISKGNYGSDKYNFICFNNDSLSYKSTFMLDINVLKRVNNISVSADIQYPRGKPTEAEWENACRAGTQDVLRARYYDFDPNHDYEIIGWKYAEKINDKQCKRGKKELLFLKKKK